jgi:hypothetical protein
MRRFRFSLGTLVILVVLSAVGLAALRESNEIWDSILFSITLGVLLISILLTVHRTNSMRALWLGFALFGSAYLGLSLIPPIESRLITTKALHYLASKLSALSSAGLAYFDYDNDGTMDLFVVNNSQPNGLLPNNGSGTPWYLRSPAGPYPPNVLAGSIPSWESFARIGHSITALIAAFVGGLLSRHLYARNRQPFQEPVSSRGSI